MRECDCLPPAYIHEATHGYSLWVWAPSRKDTNKWMWVPWASELVGDGELGLWWKAEGLVLGARGGGHGEGSMLLTGGNGRVLYQAWRQVFSHGDVKVVVQTTQGDGFPWMFFKPDCEKPWAAWSGLRTHTAKIFVFNTKQSQLFGLPAKPPTAIQAFISEIIACSCT